MTRIAALLLAVPVAALAAVPGRPTPSAATATTFDARVARAEAAIATRAGHAYDMALVPAIHDAATRCVPPGRAAPRAADSFTLVATVDAGGRVHDVDVRPQTPLSRCVARRFGEAKLQRPPRADGHPILVRVRDAF